MLEEESYCVNMFTDNFEELPADALFAAQVPLRTDSGQICIGGIADETVAYEGSLWWRVIFIERPHTQIDLYLSPIVSDSGSEAKVLKSHPSRPLVQPLNLVALPAI